HADGDPAGDCISGDRVRGCAAGVLLYGLSPHVVQPADGSGERCSGEHHSYSHLSADCSRNRRSRMGLARFAERRQPHISDSVQHISCVLWFWSISHGFLYPQTGDQELDMATNNIPASETVRSEAQKLSPTLIIGLGGTGGDVLLRIRKKFFEKFGGIEEFPIVSYLWFDTDKNYKDVGAKQFAKKVDFSNTEERLITIADTGSITSHLDQPVYRNIASWWPTGLNVIPRLDDGAGQYRPYSRLGLFYHYSRPETSIRQSI